jgi:hypothetical protein
MAQSVEAGDLLENAAAENKAELKKKSHRRTVSDSSIQGRVHQIIPNLFFNEFRLSA